MKVFLRILYLSLLVFGSLQASPRISEFLAVNIAGAVDGDGHHADWLEIHNPDGASQSLAGWYLTDDPDDLTKWRFPSQAAIGAGESTVVWASGKARAGLFDSVFHTNFLIESNSGYLALVNPEGEVVHAYEDYPAQIPDVSYGTTGEEIGYFSSPTPGGANGDPEGPPPAKVAFVQNGQTFTGSIEVELTCATEGARIRYTLDGTEPRESLFSTAPLYEGPITVSRTTRIRARSFLDGSPTGAFSEETFIKIADSMKDFSSNLPIVVIDSFGVNVDTRPRLGDLNPVSTVFLDKPEGERTSILGPVDYSGRGGLRVRGQTSAGFPKKQYKFESWDDYGVDKDVSLLGFPRESDWVIHGPYTDKTLIRNHLSYTWSRQMGNTAMRTRLCEVFRAFSGRDEVTYDDYWGVYVFMEQIKRDGDRVDIARLGYTDNAEPEITGGYIFRKDKEPEREITFRTSQERHTLQLMEPDDPTDQQLRWIDQWVDSFEEALHGQDFSDRDTGYRAYINVPSFIDLHILVEMTKNIDGFRLSSYMHKDRGEKMVLGPPWDYNLSLGNADYLDGWKPEGWYHRLIGAGDYPWFRQLFEDREFELEYWDRWFELRRGMFSTERLMERIDSVVEEVGEGAERNFQKWRRLGVYDWPNAPGVEQRDTYPKVIAFMKEWLADRVDWMDRQFEEPPVFGSPGGQVESGHLLTMGTGSLFRSGDVFYTLDGSDPREYRGEARGMLYQTPIELTETATVKARVRLKTGVWSAYNQATFIVGQPASAENLVVSEIMYHPAAPSEAEIAAGFDDADDFEYLELLNVGDVPVELAGVAFTDGITFDFDQAVIREVQPGGRVLIVQNRAAFEERYGNGLPVAGSYGENPSGRLSNGGETLAMESRETGVVFEFAYSDSGDWAEEADGGGHSLVLAEEAAGRDFSDPAAWKASGAIGGSPGRAEDGSQGGEAFDAWKQRYFSAEQLADPLVSGDEADADHDLLRTLLEYALGTNPLQADNRSVIGAKRLDIEGDPYVALEYTRNAEATDIEFYAEISGDLEVWERAGMIEVSVEDLGGGLERVVERLADPAGSDAAEYLRLRVAR